VPPALKHPPFDSRDVIEFDPPGKIIDPSIGE
jgi:hypothetical protein